MPYDVPPVPDSLLEDLVWSLGEEQAVVWLEQAKGTARHLFDTWALTPVEVLSGGSMSLCVKCDGPDGAELVLKVPASVLGGASEKAALRCWGGNGAARLLREDDGTSAMLMNFLGRVGEGGYGLADIVDLAARLHAGAPVGHDFGSLDANLARRMFWAKERFAETADEQNLADLAVTESLLVELVPSGGRQVLLHGDLQAKNLIMHGDELTAVDPLPAVGSEVFDLAFWIAKSVHVHPTVTYVDQVCEIRPDLDRSYLRAVDLGAGRDREPTTAAPGTRAAPGVHRRAQGRGADLGLSPPTGDLR